MSAEFEVTFETSEELTADFTDVVRTPPTLQTKAVTITQNGSSTVEADDGYDGLERVNVSTNVPNPSTGNLSITSTEQVDVSTYATAQVVDSDLVPENIKKDANILGVVGTYGGFDLGKNATSIRSMFYTRDNLSATMLPETVDMTAFTNVTSMDSFASRYANYSPKISAKHYIFKFNSPVSFADAFRNNDTVETITFIGGIVMTPHSYGAFINCTKLRSVYGVISPSNFWGASGNARTLSNCVSLEDITFTHNNSSDYNVDAGASRLLKNDSIVSIANNLQEGCTNKTVTFHSEVKAKCSEIVGSVSLNPTSTFHIFTEDTSGTTTLEEFITITKGWTLA